VQTVTPRAALGRVIAAVQTLSGAAQGVGLLLAGLIASSVGTVHVLDAQASLYLLCGVLALVFLGGARGGREAVPEPAASRATPS
jgi:cyanate permease